MRTLIAWSGGKDSALALGALRANSSCEIVGVLTSVTRVYDRVSMHGIRRSILRAQAERLRLPLFEALLDQSADNEQYESAWATALGQARAIVGDIDSVAYGDLFLEDVRAFRERQCACLGVTPLFPLWGRSTKELAPRAASQLTAYLTCIDTTQLDASFAGRRYDAALLADLPPAIDPCGERGEFHTCVVQAPVYDGPIMVEKGEQVLRDNRFAYCDFHLVEGSPEG